MATLLIRPEDYTSFGIGVVRDVVSNYFAIEQYDPAKNYSVNQYAVFTKYQSFVQSPNWFTELVNNGMPLIVEHLWDNDVIRSTVELYSKDEWDTARAWYWQNLSNEPATMKPHRALLLQSPNWLWYLTFLEFEHYGYKNWQPSPERKNSFLMLMNHPRWHRDLALERLAPVLDTALYSYKHRGIFLGDDNPSNTINWQRYMNPGWYNTTAFSVVTESYMRTTCNKPNNDPGGNSIRFETGPEVSEKIFKPLAHFHPFVVAGSAYTLEYLHKQGFETFPELFDESYDQILNDVERFEAVCVSIIDAVERWKRNEFIVDTNVQNKMIHNHNRFFDRNRVIQGIEQDVVNPILNFLK